MFKPLKVMFVAAWLFFVSFMFFVRVPELLSARSDGSVLFGFALSVFLPLATALLFHWLAKTKE